MSDSDDCFSVGDWIMINSGKSKKAHRLVQCYNGLGISCMANSHRSCGLSESMHIERDDMRRAKPEDEKCKKCLAKMRPYGQRRC